MQALPNFVNRDGKLGSNYCCRVLEDSLDIQLPGPSYRDYGVPNTPWDQEDSLF